MNTELYQPNGGLEDDFGGTHRLARHAQDFQFHLDGHINHHACNDSSSMSASSTSEESRLMEGVSNEEDILLQRWSRDTWAELQVQAQDYSFAMELDPQVSHSVGSEMQEMQFSMAPVNSIEMAREAPSFRPLPPIQAPTTPFYLLPALTEYEKVEEVPDEKEIFFRVLIPSGTSRGGLRGTLMIGNSCAAGDAGWLKRHGVTNMINCGEDCDRFRGFGLGYKSIPLSPLNEASPYAYFEEANRAIHSLLEAGEVVLLFCPQALGRALCIAFAYMVCHEEMTLLQCASYMIGPMRAKMFFTVAQQQALFDLNRMARRPKEVKFLKTLARPKPMLKKKETRIMVKVKVKALPKKKLVRGTRPLSSIKAEDIRRSLMLPSNSPLLGRNFTESKLGKRQASILESVLTQRTSSASHTPPASPITPMCILSSIPPQRDIVHPTTVEIPVIPRSCDPVWFSSAPSVPCTAPVTHQ